MRTLICILAICTLFIANESFAQVKATKKGDNTLVKEGKVKTDRKAAMTYATAEERAEKRTNFLSNRLSLSETQQQEVYSILLNSIQTINTADKNGLTGGAFKRTVKSARKGADTALKSILSRDQNAQYQKIKRKMRQAKN